MVKDFGKMRTQRITLLDCVRGLAVIAMIIYHFAWDLSFFGVIETDINTSPFWRDLAKNIASSFLFLSGISLYLAHKNAIQWFSFLRRLFMVAASALLVTIVTWYQFPESYIFFGILHCIALSSIIGLAFLRTHLFITWLALAVTAITVVLHYKLTNTIFDTPILAFLGLRTLPIRTNDFVPILPWISYFLLGIWFAQLHPLYTSADAKIENTPTALKLLLIIKPTIKPLQFLGRHSLIIYLIHQPILFQATGFVSSFKTKKVDEITSSFVSSCEQSCIAQGRDKQTCIETCFCTVDGLKATGIWAKISISVPDEATRAEIAKMAEICRK
jgi:uncharacterized membrane protein